MSALVAISVAPELRELVALLRRRCNCEEFVGGAAMEEALRQARFTAVIDVALGELTSGADPDRLTAAGLLGLPQVIVPGGLDVVASRSITHKEIDRLGQEIALKTSAAKGSVTIVIPERSWSAGQVLDPQTLATFIASLNHWRAPAVSIVTVDATIDDAVFADQLVAELQRITAF